MARMLEVLSLDPGMSELPRRGGFTLKLATMQVTQGGPRLLCDAAEALHRDWCRLGRPDRDRFGLTVSQDGGHEVWFDDPAAAPCWAFPPTRSCR